MLECLSRISEDEIGISSMREVNYPLQFATDDEDEDLAWLYEPISGTLELAQHLVELFPFEVNCNIGITRNFPGLKHLMGVVHVNDKKSLKQLRTERKIRQVEVAKALGMQPSRYSTLENEWAPVTEELKERILAYFEVTEDQVKFYTR